MTLAASATALLSEGMMEDQSSLVLFAVAVVGVSLLAAILLPLLINRIPLRHAVPSLALVGPGLASIGILLGMGAMTLSGREIWYEILVAVAAGTSAIIVGLRTSWPIANALGTIASTLREVSHGNHGARTGINRSDEIGDLAATVDYLSKTLERAEAERVVADEERRGVVSALSHDLRTPLASLLVSVDALEDGVGNGWEHLRAMRSNVKLLERLVDDLFLLARADSGGLDLGSERLDMAEMIDEAVDALRPVANDRQVDLSAQVVGRLEVLVDDAAIGRVLRNLLDNGVRHAPRGGAVMVRLRAVNNQAVVEVIDNGPGFEAEFVDRAFDRFSQADDARSRPGGAGLGLSIAHTLVKAHHGQIGILPGNVGRVFVTLPLAPSAPSPLVSGMH